jgi:hypothetical protein
MPITKATEADLAEMQAQLGRPMRDVLGIPVCIRSCNVKEDRNICLGCVP